MNVVPVRTARIQQQRTISTSFTAPITAEMLADMMSVLHSRKPIMLNIPKVAVFIAQTQTDYPFLANGDLVILSDRTQSSDFGWHAKTYENVEYCNVLLTNEQIEIIGDL